MSGGGVLSYTQTGLEVGRVLFFLFFDVTRKEQQMSSYFLLRPAASQTVAVSGGGVLSHQQTSLEVGRVLFFFFDVTKK